MPVPVSLFIRLILLPEKYSPPTTQYEPCTISLILITYYVLLEREFGGGVK